MKTFTFKYSPNEPSIGARLRRVVETGIPDVDPHRITSETLEGIFSFATPERLKLFYAIKNLKPTSMYDLAKRVDKDQSYVQRECKTLELLGLIKLVREKNGCRECLRPVALYQQIKIDISELSETTAKKSS